MENAKTVTETETAGDQDMFSKQRDALRRWMEVCLPDVHGPRPTPDCGNESPDSSPIAENGKTVEQKDRDRVERVAAALQAQATLFVRQGSVVATWRQYKGRRLGPYYRVAYREEGRQKSLYLGASAWVAEQVRRLLARLQTPLREHRALERAKAQVRASWRKHQARAKTLFGSLGVRVKGLEYRGFVRYLRERTRTHEAAAYEKRAAAAWRVITGADEADRGQPRAGDCPTPCPEVGAFVREHTGRPVTTPSPNRQRPHRGRIDQLATCEAA